MAVYPVKFIIDILLEEKKLDYYKNGYFDSYKANTRQYFRKIIDKIYKRTRYDMSLYPKISVDPCKIEFVILDDEFINSTIDLNEPNHATIYMSLGTFHSLNDCCLRAYCSEVFFNDLEARENQTGDYWGGCRTLELAESTQIRPIFRYSNYEPTELIDRPSIHSSQDANNIGLYINKIPMDNERLNLSALSVELGLEWIFLHEENHLRKGHLHYIADYMKEHQKSSKTAMMEHENSEFSELEPQLAKSFEVEADRAAMRDLMSLIYGTDLKNILPSYAHDYDAWRLRYIVVSIGLAILTLDRDRLEVGDTETPSYPPIRVRFCSVIQAALSELVHIELKQILREKGVEPFLEKIVRYCFAIGQAVHDIDCVRDHIESDKDFDGEDNDPLFDKDYGSMVAGAVYAFDGLKDIIVSEGVSRLLDVGKIAHLEDIKNSMVVDHPHRVVDDLFADYAAYTNFVKNAEKTLSEQRALFQQCQQNFNGILKPYREQCSPH